VDLSKLKPGDWLIGGGMIVFFIALFLPWYGLDTGFGSVDNSGWDYMLGAVIPWVLLAIAFVIAVLPKFVEGVKIPDPVGPLPKAQAVLVLCAVALVIVILRLVIGSDNVGSVDVDVDLDRKIGLFLGLIAAIAATVGAFLKFSGKEVDGPTAGSGPATPF
jgi:hypothetical protein